MTIIIHTVWQDVERDIPLRMRRG